MHVCIQDTNNQNFCVVVKTLAHSNGFICLFVLSISCIIKYILIFQQNSFGDLACIDLISYIKLGYILNFIHLEPYIHEKSLNVEL